MIDETTLHEATPQQRAVLERLGQLYRHDLSEFRGTLPDAEGRFPFPRLAQYLPDEPDPDRRAYLIRRGGDLAGFAFVRGLVAPPRVLGELFVLRAFRRTGVGQDVARQLFRMHPGRWEIAFQEENPGAARFWRQVATEAVGAAFREERRPVPDKPHLPPDTWLCLEV